MWPKPAPIGAPSVNGQESTRMQESSYRKKQIETAISIQRNARGFLLRRSLQRAGVCIAALQTREKGFLTRQRPHVAEMRIETDDAVHTASLSTTVIRLP